MQFCDSNYNYTTTTKVQYNISNQPRHECGGSFSSRVNFTILSCQGLWWLSEHRWRWGRGDGLSKMMISEGSRSVDVPGAEWYGVKGVSFLVPPASRFAQPWSVIIIITCYYMLLLLFLVCSFFNYCHFSQLIWTVLDTHFKRAFRTRTILRTLVSHSIFTILMCIYLVKISVVLCLSNF